MKIKWLKNRSQKLTITQFKLNKRIKFNKSIQVLMSTLDTNTKAKKFKHKLMNNSKEINNKRSLSIIGIFNLQSPSSNWIAHFRESNTQAAKRLRKILLLAA